MHATITTTCPSCGSVDLDLVDVMVVVVGDGPGWYVFDCLGCARQVVKDAPEPAVAVLARADVAVHTMPAEVAERWHAGSPALDADALLDAVLLLGCTDHLAALAARPAG